MKQVDVKLNETQGYPVHGNVTFCHVSKEGRGWDWYGCVGWLWDDIQVEMTDKGHGYSGGPLLGFISTDKFRLGVTGMKKPELYTNAVGLINLFERECGMKLTKLYATTKEDCYITVAHKDWMQSSFMISLFTNLIRLAENGLKADTVEEFNTRFGAMPKYSGAAYYFKRCFDKIPEILRNREDLTWKKFPYNTKLSIHSYGIGALVCKHSQFSQTSSWEAAKQFQKKVGIRDDLS